jgi:CRISPR-associated endonuclease Cas1
MHSDDTLYGRIKNGVVTLSGNASRITVDGGCLRISDGFEGQSAELSFRRADCPVSRVIVTRPKGFVSFAALKWMHDVGVSLIQLDWNADVILATAARQFDFPGVRRAQSVAFGSELGLGIAREILRAKIKGQAAVSRFMNNERAASSILEFCKQLDDARSSVEFLAIESQAAGIYWQGWSLIPIQFARKDKVPAHWQTFGTRQSPMTNSPRRAATAGNTLLNYLYGVAAGQVTAGLIKAGLDPGLGVFHVDKPNRASLVYDALECIRPIVDLWLFFWMTEVNFAKRDFFEGSDGTIRVTRPLNSHLAMTAALWRAPAEDVAFWIAKRLAGEKASLKLSLPQYATNINEEARRHVRRWQISGVMEAPLPTTCIECGAALPLRRRKFCSSVCAASNHDVAEFRQVRGERMRRNIEAIREWRASDKSSKEEDGVLRQWFSDALQPALMSCRPSDIKRATGVSTVYASMIRNGRYVPHPRHYTSLARLAGLALPAVPPFDQNETGSFGWQPQ